MSSTIVLRASAPVFVPRKAAADVLVQSAPAVIHHDKRPEVEVKQSVCGVAATKVDHTDDAARGSLTQYNHEESRFTISEFPQRPDARRAIAKNDEDEASRCSLSEFPPRHHPSREVAKSAPHIVSSSYPPRFPVQKMNWNHPTIPAASPRDLVLRTVIDMPTFDHSSFQFDPRAALFVIIIDCKGIKAQLAEQGKFVDADAPDLVEFEITKELGDGGQAIVYLLRARTPDAPLKECVMKVFRLQRVSRGEAREIEIARWLSSPGVPARYVDAAVPYLRATAANPGLEKAILMEVMADSLENVLRRRRLPNGHQGIFRLEALSQCKQVLTAVAEMRDALRTMYNEAIVNSDMKPDNFLVDKHGKIRMSDFGIMVSHHEGMMGEGGGGTLSWSAPEQLGRLARNRNLAAKVGAGELQAWVRYCQSARMSPEIEIWACGLVCATILYPQMPPHPWFSWPSCDRGDNDREIITGLERARNMLDWPTWQAKYAGEKDADVLNFFSSCFRPKGRRTTLESLIAQMEGLVAEYSPRESLSSSSRVPRSSRSDSALEPQILTPRSVMLGYRDSQIRVVEFSASVDDSPQVGCVEPAVVWNTLAVQAPKPKNNLKSKFKKGLARIKRFFNAGSGSNGADWEKWRYK